MFVLIQPKPARGRCTIRVVESFPDNFTGILEFCDRAFVRARVEELTREYEGRGMSVRVLGDPFHYSIYVLELLPEVQGERKMSENNRPISKHPPKAFFYVGMTGLPVEQRVQNHLRGYKSCSLVTKYYSGRIFTTRTDLTYSEAVELERRYAGELRTQGYWVYQK